MRRSTIHHKSSRGRWPPKLGFVGGTAVFQVLLRGQWPQGCQHPSPASYPHLNASSLRLGISTVYLHVAPGEAIRWPGTHARHLWQHTFPSRNRWNEMKWALGEMF